MTERYKVNSPRTLLEFDDKDTEAVNDYLIDFTPMLDVGQALVGTPEVEIEAAGNAESPIELTVLDVSLAALPDATESPAPDVAVYFWLSRGSPNCRYRGKIKCKQNSVVSPSQQRTLVKRFYVVTRGEALSDVDTVPGIPTIGAAVGGNANASVSFTAPESDGGRVITGYTVTASPGGASGAGTTSPVTVYGLSNGTEYTFTVHATNALGSGEESSASNAVTPSTPTADGSIVWGYTDGVLSWGGDFTQSNTSVDYHHATALGLDGHTQSILFSATAGFGLFLPYFASDYTYPNDSYRKLLISLKPKNTGDTFIIWMELVGDVDPGLHLQLLDYGPPTVAGQWGSYVIPLADLGVLNEAQLYKMALQFNSPSTTEWEMDNLGFQR